MGWFKPTQVTIQNGEKLVTIVSGDSIANIQPEDGLIIGSFSPVEISKAYVGAGDVQLIELADSWADSTQTAVPAKVLATAGDFAAATQRLKDATTITSDNFAAMDKWGTDLGTIDFVNLAGSTNTVRTLSQMDADVQAIQDGNQSIVDTSVSDSIGTIRYGKLDNPLVHILKKNKLVDTLKGELSWTRDSGATYIDQYGKLQYSPSPYATNLLTYSEDFSNAAWNKNSDITTAQLPRNANDHFSWNRIEALLTNADTKELKQSLTLAENQRVALSFYVKPDQVKFLTVRLDTPQESDCRFNLDLYKKTSTRGVGAIAIGVSISFHQKKDEPLRVSVIFSAGSGQNNIKFWLADGSNYNASSALNSGDGLYLSATQLEESRVANGYVKTEATSDSGSSYVGIDVARQEKEGWLIEGASTNRQLQSGDVNILNSGWSTVYGGTASSAVCTSNEGEAPDGSLTAARIQLNKGGGDTSGDDCQIRGAYSSVIGESITFSIWLKGYNGDTPTIRTDFNGTTPSDGDLLITLTSEWKRYAWTLESPIDTGRSLRMRLRGTQGTSDTADFLAWGGQAEPLPFATSYIPTTDAPATRSNGENSIPYEGNVPRGDQPFTFVFRGVLDGQHKFNRLFDTDESDAESKLRAHVGGNGEIYLTDGSDNSVAGTTPITLGVPFTYVATYDGVTYKSYLDGVFQSESASTTPASALPSALRIMQGYSSANDAYGTCSDFRVYDFAFNDLEAAFLSGE